LGSYKPNSATARGRRGTYFGRLTPTKGYKRKIRRQPNPESSLQGDLGKSLLFTAKGKENR